MRKFMDRALTALVVLLVITVVAVYMNAFLVIRTQEKMMNEIRMEENV